MLMQKRSMHTVRPHVMRSIAALPYFALASISARHSCSVEAIDVARSRCILLKAFSLIRSSGGSLVF